MFSKSRSTWNLFTNLQLLHKVQYDDFIICITFKDRDIIRLVSHS